MEAYLDWQSKSGGIKLNDVIEEYRYVAAGKSVKKGDFLTYVGEDVTPAIEPPFNAVALSSGVGGTVTEHNEQVKIARPRTVNEFDLIINGDFSNGLEGWNTSSTISASVIDGVASFWGASSSAGARGMTQTINKQLTQNHLYYVCVDGKVPSEFSGDDAYAVVVCDTTNLSIGNLTKDNSWHTLSILYKAEQDVVVKSIQLLVYNSSSTTYWDNVKMIDLTKMYGAGNEPTKEWCDTNLGGEA